MLEDNAFTLTDDDATVQSALKIIAGRMTEASECISASNALKLAALQIGSEERENFLCIFLDNGYRLITSQVLSKGSKTGVTVSTREILKAALACNADYIVCAHNHPNGCTEPSDGDMVSKKKMKKVFELVGIPLIDYIVVSGNRGYSCFEQERM